MTLTTTLLSYKNAIENIESSPLPKNCTIEKCTSCGYYGIVVVTPNGKYCAECF